MEKKTTDGLRRAQQSESNKDHLHHPRAGEPSDTAEGTQEEVWALKRNKVPLLGRARGGGVDHHKNIFLCTHTDSHRAVLWVARYPLCGLWAMGHRGFLGRWSMGSGDLCAG